jgi:hypothetical protein
VSGVFLFVLIFNGVASASYADLRTLIETTTATFGTLLGIITAGLMFTQGKYGELTAELSEKSPHYLRNVLSLEELRSIGAGLLTLKKVFGRLVDETEVLEEKKLYERITSKSSYMFVNVAVLLNLKFRQEGLPGGGLLISDMNAKEHEDYQEKSRALKKDWHLFGIVKQIVDTWATVAVLPAKTDSESSLHSEVSGSIPVLRLKEEVIKSSERVHLEVEKVLHGLAAKIDKVVVRYHEDRIPQLLTQMEQSSIVRGRYFYLSLVFIAAPLLVNLLVLPQFSEGVIVLLREVVALTSVLAVLGVVTLLFYVHKMLNV